MAINCSSNALLDSLNASKDALAGQLSALKTSGAGALDELKSKASSMKDSFLSAMPEIPEVPNFKKEIQDLKNKSGEQLVKAKAEFKARWGDALPDIDIDDLIAKVTSPFSNGFDLCKDVPNIDAPEVNATTGKVESVKVKGPEPTTPAAIPEKSSAAEITVVSKENAVTSSGLSQKTRSEIINAMNEVDLRVREFKEPYAKAFASAQKEYSLFVKSDKWARLKKKLANGQKLSDYYNSGNASSGEKKDIDDFYTNNAIRFENASIAKGIGTYFKNYQLSSVKDGFSSDSISTKITIHEYFKNTAGNITLRTKTDELILVELKKILDENKDTIVAYVSYLLSKQG